MEFSSCGLEGRNMRAYNLHPFVTAMPLHLCSAPIAFLVTALPQHYCEKNHPGQPSSAQTDPEETACFRKTHQAVYLLKAESICKAV